MSDRAVFTISKNIHVLLSWLNNESGKATLTFYRPDFEVEETAQPKMTEVSNCYQPQPAEVEKLTASHFIWRIPFQKIQQTIETGEKREIFPIKPGEGLPNAIEFHLESSNHDLTGVRAELKESICETWFYTILKSLESSFTILWKELPKAFFMREKIMERRGDNDLYEFRISLKKTPKANFLATLQDILNDGKPSTDLLAHFSSEVKRYSDGDSIIFFPYWPHTTFKPKPIPISQIDEAIWFKINGGFSRRNSDSTSQLGFGPQINAMTIRIVPTSPDITDVFLTTVWRIVEEQLIPALVQKIRERYPEVGIIPTLLEENIESSLITHQTIPAKKVAYDNLCIRWVNRGYMSNFDLQDFLLEVEKEYNFISKTDFYRILADAHKRGVIEKVGRRYVPKRKNDH